MQGHSEPYLKRGIMSERSGGKDLQPVVLPDLQGKGYERKEVFLLT